MTVTLAPIATASFFVTGAAKRRPLQKRYSEKREKASKKIKMSDSETIS